MSDRIRTEEWTTDLSGMISTVVVDVLEGETVYVSSQVMKEMRLDPASSKEVVPPGAQYFVNEFPYALVRSALVEQGWSYAGTS